jgi:hypothetical protein
MKKITTFCVIVLIVVAIIFTWKFSNITKNVLTTPTPQDATFTIDAKSGNLKDQNGATKYFGNDVSGDFNNDGKKDTAFLITQDNGGSGTFYYIVAALKTNDGYIGTNAVFVGDRIAPQTMEFKDNLIIFNYAIRKPTDPMTTPPSVGASNYFSVDKNNTLSLVQF